MVATVRADPSLSGHIALLVVAPTGMPTLVVVAPRRGADVPVSGDRFSASIGPTNLSTLTAGL